MKKSFDKNYLWITLIGAVLFLPFLGMTHLFDWDEINFAECAREMLLTHNYSRLQINFQPFWEKPPLFIWLQVLSMKCFGVTEFAARLPNAIAGIATLIVIYHIGKKLFAKIFGITWVLIWCSTYLCQFYFKSGIIDPVFNLFIFLSLSLLIRFLFSKALQEKSKNTDAILAGLFAGLATLTKGPVALLIISIVVFVFWLLNRKQVKFWYKEFWWSLIVAITVISFWFLPETLLHGTWFIKEFIAYQVRLFNTGSEGHAEPFYYHFVVILFGCFPAVIFFIDSFSKSKAAQNQKQKKYFNVMLILFWVVLILFSIVKTKIVHYSSLTYLPLTFVAAWSIKEIVHQKKFSLLAKISFVFLSVFWLAVFVLIPLAGKNTNWIKPFVHDAFALENLNAAVQWQGHNYFPAIILLLGVSLFIYFFKRNLKLSFTFVMIANILAAQYLFYCIIPKIESYSQGAEINFYKSIADKNCYVFPYNFKSYAHLFYTKRKPDYNAKASDMLWLLKGKIDKPAFFVCRKGNEPFDQYNGVKKFGDENGYVFYYRLPDGF